MLPPSRSAWSTAVAPQHSSAAINPESKIVFREGELQWFCLPCFSFEPQKNRTDGYIYSSSRVRQTRLPKPHDSPTDGRSAAPSCSRAPSTLPRKLSPSFVGSFVCWVESESHTLQQSNPKVKMRCFFTGLFGRETPAVRVDLICVRTLAVILLVPLVTLPLVPTPRW